MVATAQRAAPKRNFGFLQSSGPVAGFGIWRWCWLMKLLGSAVRVCSWITCGSVTSAMTRSPPPHFGHTDKSIANMRFNRRIGGEVLLEERARHRQDVRHWHLQRICDPGGGDPRRRPTRSGVLRAAAGTRAATQRESWRRVRATRRSRSARDPDNRSHRSRRSPTAL